jgi:hypothetical protein
MLFFSSEPYRFELARYLSVTVQILVCVPESLTFATEIWQIEFILTQATVNLLLWFLPLL